ncbi:MAG: peptide-N-glycosidase F-related protein [Chitinophagales bacterium]
MKKYLCLLFIASIINLASKANPGDTTWVQANNTQLTYYGNFDTTITFPAPGTSYRKIYMIFTLGKYMCPGYTYGTGAVPWCGDWDYTVMNYLMTPGGDTLELGRLITPYANNGAPRTPWTWQQHYVFDVTDYAYLLQGSASMRILYSGYSGGFTANIRFAFIEGTPDRDVIAIKRLWRGTYGYGDTTHHDSNDINPHFLALPETAPALTQTADLKFTVTGHGSDSNGCCEFYPGNYKVVLNGSAIDSTIIWRNDCGFNELYPQSGTWIYNRGNWCPGALVYSHFHDLPGISAGTNYNVAIQFAPYVRWGSGGVYTTEATLIYYAAMNKTLDASLDRIISPTSDENHFRENPISAMPVVHIKNTGTTTITSMQLACYVDGGAPFYYSWAGSLSSLQETDITFPVEPDIKSASGTSGVHNFMAQIVMVNGNTGDDDSTNNVMTSSFTGAPLWPLSFKIQMRTNNETDSTGNCETRWQIFDESNTVVASRLVSAINTTYIDTVNLAPGSYQLVITDGSCDGLQWWANSGTGISAGYLNVKKLTGVNIPMNGYTYGGTYNNDFGCGFTQYFTTNWPAGVNDLSESHIGLEAYPNPAQNTVNIDISGMQQVKGKIQVIDVLGRVVSEKTFTDIHSQLNVEELSNGVYTLLFIDDKQPNIKLATRLLIAK